MFAQKKDRGQGVVEAILLVILAIVVIWAVVGLSFTPNRITDERALPRLAEIAGVPQKEIQVLNKTDASPWTGNSYDVSYELFINNEYVSARCTVSGWWSDMVCRLYTGGE
jgi:hypothetical protein